MTVAENQNLDQRFPSLSLVAKRNRTSLESLASSARSHDGYLSIADACSVTKLRDSLWSHADAFDYLATLDAFLKRHQLNRKACSEFWGKISQTKESQFLDTVCEAAWAVYFMNRGFSFEYEARFDPQVRDAKNADFLIGSRNAGLWLDVCSVQVEPPNPPTSGQPCSAHLGHSRDAVISLALSKAVNKYKSKFEDAVRTGPLNGQATGVLLGFLKAEKDIIPGLFPDLLTGQNIPAPANLFSKANPGLILVWGFILTRASNGTHLVPSLIFSWSHPVLDGKPLMIQPEQLHIQKSW